jgi:hypothetical protein
MSSARWWLGTGAAVLVLGCATSPSPRPEAAPEAAAAPTAPKDDDLEKAWAPTPEPKPPAEPSPEARVAQPPPPADRRAGYREALDATVTALQAKRLDDARAAADKACTEAADLTGDERAKAWATAFKVAVTEGEPNRATDVALAWRLACGPDGLDACRAAAVRALGQVVKLKGADAKALKALVKSLQDADGCVAAAERSGTGPACLAATEKTAAKHKDELLAARVLYAKALAEKSDAKKAALLAKAEARCDAPSCAGVRRKALSKQVALALAANDLEAALKLTLRDAEVAASLAEPEQRPWARTPELDKLCVKYDAANGAGACRRVEKQLTGGWTFRDFSKDKGVGEGLAPDQVKVVNEHYAVLAQECLAEQARRLIPPDAQRYEVSWAVQNDGRVREAHLRRDLDDTPLAKCLRQQFSAWRYPRFTGELQHVEQSFLVTAVERRPVR